MCVRVCYSYAESVGAVHYSASAKHNKGIQELFLDLSKSKSTHSHHSVLVVCRGSVLFADVRAWDVVP